jgi:hypothetical protein
VSRLSNFSVRSFVGTGEQALIAGFAIPPGAARQLVIRGLGPALSAFGVVDVLPDPTMELFGDYGSIHKNDSWGIGEYPVGPLFAGIGAFQLPAGSRDAAFTTRSLASRGIRPGNYTVLLRGNDGGTGTGMLELYEADNQSERLTNFSVRAFLQAGGNAITGFVVVGPVPKRVLVRAAGPALAALGVNVGLSNPHLEVRDATGRVVAENDDWQSQSDAAGVGAAGSSVGAFTFAEGSKDAALALTLLPGNYTAVVTEATGRAGVGLIELYELP